MIIEDKSFDEERALYNLKDSEIKNCRFAGPADGESALKEAGNIIVSDCSFKLRYPLWHVNGFKLLNSDMNDKARAAIWYARDGVIDNCELNGIKAVRECNSISLTNCKIDSPEFGWKSDKISLIDTSITSEYLFFGSSNVNLCKVNMKGKYSFQYVENLVIENSNLDTKDAFWHARNITVKNSTVKGEYLAWFSDGLTMIDCKIIGTQPLCYCKNLKLINCTMEETDLAFEYSEVDAKIIGNVESIKNPLSGTIIVDSVGEIIREDPVYECSGEVVIR